MNASAVQQDKPQSRQSGMSYKFQRLREKIREAVESGELTGKLPGERTLARRFHVNAKTLSKALTDLAAEGILDRSIGRGTYVKGSAPVPAATIGRWLVLVEPAEIDSCIVDGLKRACPELETIPSLEAVRPSFLNQFTAVIDLCISTPDTLVRNLLVRNMPVIAVNREPSAYSLNAVMIDTTLGATRLCRDLILAGHRRLGAIEPLGDSRISRALRSAAARHGSDVLIESAEPREAATLAKEGVTAMVCGSARAASFTRATLKTRGVRVPQDVSLTAVGCACSSLECSGYFVECDQITDAVAGLLKDVPLRPVSLWLAGKWIDRSTLAPVPMAIPELRGSTLESHIVQ
ncbi:MAG TPA: GntR family transcriptional regulator [Tepidisphaeraceae bacterium]|jgi:hypothetical protein